MEYPKYPYPKYPVLNSKVVELLVEQSRYVKDLCLEGIKVLQESHAKSYGMFYCRTVNIFADTDRYGDVEICVTCNYFSIEDALKFMQEDMAYREAMAKFDSVAYEKKKTEDRINQELSRVEKEIKTQEAKIKDMHAIRQELFNKLKG